jgi:hypothetical protein
MRQEFTLSGAIYAHYYEDENGVIKQHNPQPFIYDEKYCSTYDTPEYKKGSDILQALRLSYCLGIVGHELGGFYGLENLSLLDVGYGNGAFLKFCQKCSNIKKLYGYDITGIKIPGVEVIPDLHFVRADIITFWDCLEHFNDVSFLHNIDASIIVVSLPYCHIKEKGIQWFDTWKHRKPNEHIRHFDRISLMKFMRSYGWKNISLSYHEDIIRAGVDSPNILTMAFKRT